MDREVDLSFNAFVGVYNYLGEYVGKLPRWKLRQMGLAARLSRVSATSTQIMIFSSQPEWESASDNH